MVVVSYCSSMFGRPFRIGRLFGINITVSWSTLLVVGLVSYAVADDGNVARGLAMGLSFSVMLFVSILLHELGHSLVAQRLGVEIAEIELHFFGGTAKMLSAPRTPWDEILISAAGPLVSLSLAGLFIALAMVPVAMFVPGDFVFELGVRLFWVNLAVLGCFNLLPAIPMDGGRILRAVLARRYGALRATRVAVTVARVVAVMLALLGLVTGHFVLLALMFFIWVLGTRELRLAEMLHGRRDGLEVFDRFGRPVGTAPASYVVTGGASENGAASAWRPRPDADYVWNEAPSSFHPRMSRLVVVRGPDGRLWVITQR